MNYRKHGGIHFLSIGRMTFTFSRKKRAHSPRANHALAAKRANIHAALRGEQIPFPDFNVTPELAADLDRRLTR